MRQLAFDAVESPADFGFRPSGYTELPIDGDSILRTGDVLPILSRLSHQEDKRWLTCVNTPVLAKKVAKAADISPEQLLQVRSSEKLDTAEVIKKALRAGLSHTVIGYCGDLTITQREELKQCAEMADCQCLVLTHG